VANADGTLIQRPPGLGGQVLNNMMGRSPPTGAESDGTGLRGGLSRRERSEAVEDDLRPARMHAARRGRTTGAPRSTPPRRRVRAPDAGCCVGATASPKPTAKGSSAASEARLRPPRLAQVVRSGDDGERNAA